jgi:hypothetical protein
MHTRRQRADGLFPQKMDKLVAAVNELQTLLYAA